MVNYKDREYDDFDQSLSSNFWGGFTRLISSRPSLPALQAFLYLIIIRNL